MRNHLDYLGLYAENIVPIGPGDKFPATLVNGGWQPLKAWQKLGTVPRFLARAWVGMGAYVGLRGGPQGLLGIDVDATDRSIAGAVLEALEVFFGRLPIRSVAHKAHVKFLALCRVPMTVRSANFTFKQPDGSQGQIQLISHGRQFVTDGIHKDRKVPYVWSKHPTEELPPMLSEEEFDAFMAELPLTLEAAGATEVGGGLSQRKRTGKKGDECDFTTLKNYLALIPNDKSFADYDKWMAMCHALFGASGGSGDALELWVEWCSQVDQDLEYCREKWSSIDPSEVATGAHELRRWARERAPGEVAKLDFLSPPDEEVMLAHDTVEARGQELFDNWCLVNSKPPTFYLMNSLVATSAEGFNNTMARHEPLIRKAFKTKTLGPAKVFAKFGQSAAYSQRVPGKGHLFEDQLGNTVLNMWRPSPRPWRGKPVDAEIIERYREHVRYVLRTDEAVELWFKWNAFLLQFPEQNPGWHWLIQSGQGLGKDILLRPVIAAHGEANTMSVRSGDFLRDFNTYAERRLIYVSELDIPNSDKRSGYNTLKEVTSANPFVHVNNKYGAEYDAHNNAAFVMFSNEERPMFIAEDDRRFYVIDSKDVVADKSGEYFDELTQMYDQYNGMITEYLYAYPLTKADTIMLKFRAPGSEAKAKLVDANLAPWAHDLRDIMGEIEAGSGDYRPIATSEEIREWLKARGGPQTSRLDTNVLFRLGIIPAIPDAKNPKKAGVCGRKRLWLLIDIWVDPKTNVEYKLSNLGGGDLYRLWLSGKMGPPTLRVVNDNEDDASETE